MLAPALPPAMEPTFTPAELQILSNLAAGTRETLLSQNMAVAKDVLSRLAGLAATQSLNPAPRRPDADAISNEVSTSSSKVFETYRSELPFGREHPGEIAEVPNLALKSLRDSLELVLCPCLPLHLLSR